MNETKGLCAAAIRAARKNKMWSQVDLAARAGVSLATVRTAEAGLASKRTLSALSRAMGVKFDELTGRHALKAELALVKLAGFEVAMAVPLALSRELGPKATALRFVNAINAAYEAGRVREFALLGELRLIVDGETFTVRGDTLSLKGGEFLPCFVALPEGIEGSPVYCVVEHHDFSGDDAETAEGGQ